MYILINPSFWGIKYLDFKLLEILKAHTHLNNNNKKTICSYNKHPSSSGFKYAWSRYSGGVIRNYPSLALLSFLLASFSGRLSFCGSKMASSSSRYMLCQFSNPTERNYLPPDNLSKRLRIVSI